MALIRMNLDPDERQLRWFGPLILLFFALLGAVVLWRTGSGAAAAVLWSLGAILGLVSALVRPLRRPLYVLWMRAAYPIGWTISHLLMAVVYYLVLTPIGLVMRLTGRDPMQRRLDPHAPTYWVEHDPGTDATRYFRQS